MATLLVTFGVFLLVIVLMAIGVLMGRKSIAGSCGGLNNVGIEKECNCEVTCDSHRLYQISEPSVKYKINE
ncbi:(Na+)-NQR maturation NqrM [Vibrio tapetis]|nr:(Na+)-NQR maturation NqrM [Vibrio tapetis]